MAEDIHEQLTKYLTDAHSIEEQALQQLRMAPDIAGEPELARALREHLTETEGHERRVRELLEARGGSPSTLKDVVMRAGGAGFVLFARAQTDTPGKLAAHALSYEALEWASYDLLARVADRAGETEVAEAARTIQADESGMMGRIEELFDRTVAASLADVPAAELQDKLRSFLADAHAIEEQAIQLLMTAPAQVESTTLARRFEEHLEETREQQELVEERLTALGWDPSSLKDAALRLGALNWGMFFQAHPDTPGKLAAFAYAFEHLEIGAYEQLRRVAERAGDEDTAHAAGRILAQERAAAEKLAGVFDEAVNASLASQGVR
jgi:ferritin-like metal-binding protein YciE